jgi:hypothetical protein
LPFGCGTRRRVPLEDRLSTRVRAASGVHDARVAQYQAVCVALDDAGHFVGVTSGSSSCHLVGPVRHNHSPFVVPLTLGLLAIALGIRKPTGCC